MITYFCNRALAESVPPAKDGLKIMGCAAQGESEAMLGPLQLRLKPATERLQKAKKLAIRVEGLTVGSSSKSSLHEAWRLLRFCAKEALSYDTRTIPRSVLQPLLLEHSASLRSACEHLIGTSLSESSWARLQLPGPLGGMGFTLPLTSADAAYAATWQSTAKRVQTACSSLGRPVMELCDYNYLS